MTHDELPARLSRAQAAAVLQEAGYPIARATLAKLACRSEGPAYLKFRRRALYDPRELLQWAESQLRPPHRVAADANRDREGAAL